LNRFQEIQNGLVCLADTVVMRKPQPVVSQLLYNLVNEQWIAHVKYHV